MAYTKENMRELLSGLSLEDVTLLAEMAKQRQSEMERDRIREAEVKFIKAYQDFRKIAPNATSWICWEYETNDGNIEEQDFDLYEMLDFAVERGYL